LVAAGSLVALGALAFIARVFGSLVALGDLVAAGSLVALGDLVAAGSLVALGDLVAAGSLVALGALAFRPRKFVSIFNIENHVGKMT
jgi:hypothetical protein